MLAIVGILGVAMGFLAWISSAIISRKKGKQIILPPLSQEVQEKCVYLLEKGDRTTAIRVLAQESKFSLKAASGAVDRLSDGKLLPSTWEEVAEELRKTTFNDLNQRIEEGDVVGAQKVLARQTNLGLVEGRDLVRSIRN